MYTVRVESSGGGTAVTAGVSAPPVDSDRCALLEWIHPE